MEAVDVRVVVTTNLACAFFLATMIVPVTVIVNWVAPEETMETVLES
jgi:hypothetical protein